MIYVTGDIHGSIDIRKLDKNKVTEKITKDDYVIICGDFGLVWNYKKEDSKERKWLKWLNNRPWTTLFVDGNHECFPRLNSFPVKEWHGGRVHEIRPKVLHLMRGEIFEIDGNTIFAMGGASSHDRGPVVGDTEVVRGKSWWPEEIPSDEERAFGFNNLEAHGFKVDYIISHCLPNTFQGYIKQGTFPNDLLTEYFDYVNEMTTYKHWYTGHYHVNVDITNKLSVLFSRIVPIGGNVAQAELIMGIPKYRLGETVMVMHDGEPCMGRIEKLHPFGPTIFKNDEPYYDVAVYCEEFPNVIERVKETAILEKSLMG